MCTILLKKKKKKKKKKITSSIYFLKWEKMHDINYAGDYFEGDKSLFGVDQWFPNFFSESVLALSNAI